MTDSDSRFIHSTDLYSASSSSLGYYSEALPDTALILCRS